MNKKACFIGHRNIWNENLKIKLAQVVEQEILTGTKHFTMGTHGDFDKVALNVCKDLRNRYKDIVIEVVIIDLQQLKTIVKSDPILGIEKYIPYDDVETVIYDTEQCHYKAKIISSNKQMVDNCTTLICYVNENKFKSGAKLILKYAKRKGLKIINLFTNGI